MPKKLAQRHTESDEPQVSQLHPEQTAQQIPTHDRVNHFRAVQGRWS
jgi:hypothetical protein